MKNVKAVTTRKTVLQRLREEPGITLRAFVWSVAAVLLFSQSAYAAEEITYIHNDALGSPVAATDEAGNIKWREGYQPYGSRTIRDSASADNDLWFTGKPWDKGAGLQYFGARWYDPAVGRFMGIDPVGVDPGNVHSFNRYAYANNNPYGFVDPDGNEAVGVAITMRSDGDTFDGPFGTVGSLQRGTEQIGTAIEVADTVSDVVAPIKGGAKLLVKQGVKFAKSRVTKGAGKKADDVIQVTKDGVALPAKPKYKIPENYVQNPHRSGSYGEVVNGKFKERLRIDPPTQPGKKGPNYSHYHKNGKGKHYSPRPGDPDPGF